MPQDRAMGAFVIHLGVYVLLVGLLAALNLYRNPNHIWFIWVLAGWGIGVAAHDLALCFSAPGGARRSSPMRGCGASSSTCSSMSR